MIDLNKKYKTKGGLEVKLFMIDEATVFGVYKQTNNKWYQWAWRSATGRASIDHLSDLDLVEEVEPIETTLYYVQYKDGSIYMDDEYPTEFYLIHASKLYKKQIALTEDDLVKTFTKD